MMKNEENLVRGKEIFGEPDGRKDAACGMKRTVRQAVIRILLT